MSLIFRYHAKDESSKDRTGEIEALNEKEAIKELQTEGLCVISISTVENRIDDSPIKICPYCAEQIKQEAIKCKHCGEMLSAKQSAQSMPEPTKQLGGNSMLRIFGLLTFLAGFGVLIYYWQFFDTSVPVPTQELFGQIIGGGRVHNIGLMAERQNGIAVGSVIAILGFICVLIGEYAHKKQ